MDTHKDDEIDLIALLKTVFLARRFVIKTTILFAIYGVILALVSPTKYTASATFVPQLSEGQTNSSLGGLASLAGINLSAIMGSQPQDISPSLYPQIAESIPYRLALLEAKVGPNDTSFRNYILDQSSGSAILPLLKKYTIGLPGLLLNKQTDNNEPLDNTLFQITEEDKDLFEFLAQVASIEVDDQEGLVSISVELADRMVAAQLAQAATDLLQNNIIAFKSQSARNNLDFIKRQYESKRQEFEQIQDSIAVFKDQNLNITSSLYQNQLTRLESQFSVTSSVFQELAGQVEQAKIQVNKDTPIFTIIEPVSVPLDRSKPKRTMMVIIWTFLGGVFSVGWVLVKSPVQKIIKELRS
ncbi:MAG: Wzz/FepE/Etk N-terminal domain-containing protein [Flavobacteriaceae bacterium]|nr:Wzz/FepE/Etk N-terminal domain-containing protein [Flavobacteriaceae bacterium]